MSEDIVPEFRGDKFIKQVGSDEQWLNLISQKLSQVYRLNDEMRNYVEICSRKIGVNKVDYIGVHIRRGDKIKSMEMENLALDRYVDAIRRVSTLNKVVYVATDDISVIEIIKQKLGSEYTVLYNIFHTISGFDESSFNRKNRYQRLNDTKLAILDVELLRQSAFFIGTYSSNLSRIMPCFKGIENCESIDIAWNPVF